MMIKQKNKIISELSIYLNKRALSSTNNPEKENLLFRDASESVIIGNFISMVNSI